MDMSSVIQLINGVGFPIVACLGMGWFIVWNKKTSSQTNKEIAEKNNEMYNKIKESLDNNTAALNELVKRLGEK